MKVLGGIKGIANGINKLGKYFIIAPEINQIIENFCEAFDIEDYNGKRDEHHELTGNKNQHITSPLMFGLCYSTTTKLYTPKQKCVWEGVIESEILILENHLKL